MLKPAPAIRRSDATAALLSPSRGDVLFRGASRWDALTPGTAGLPLLSGGAGADPAYGALAIGAVTGLQAAIDLKAPLASPAFTAIPTVPTAAPGTNTTQAASTAFVLANAGSTNASDLTTGTLADARLSANVPLKDAANTFTIGPQTIRTGSTGSTALALERFSAGQTAPLLTAAKSVAEGGALLSRVAPDGSMTLGNVAAFDTAGALAWLGFGIPAGKAALQVFNTTTSMNAVIIDANGLISLAGVLTVGATDPGRYSIFQANPSDGTFGIGLHSYDILDVIFDAGSGNRLRFRGYASATQAIQSFVGTGWSDSTLATRKGFVTLTAADFAGDREGIRVGTDGTQPLLSFFNGTPVARGAAVADATDNPSAITQLNTLLARLRAYNLLAT